MADATLDSIDTAIFTALRRINPGADAKTPGTSADARESRVRYIGRWMGEPIRATTLNDAYRVAIQSQINGRTPAILLGFDGETVDPRPLMVATVGGDAETIALSTWTIMVVVRDTRTANTTLKGSAAGADETLGVYELLGTVDAALSNLMVDGLYNASNLRFLERRAYLLVPNELTVYAIRYTARRRLPDVREEGLDPTYIALSGVPLIDVIARVNLYPEGLAGDFPQASGSAATGNPVNTFEALAPLGVNTTPGTAPPMDGIVAWWSASAINGAYLDPAPPGGYPPPWQTGAPGAIAAGATLTPFPMPADGMTAPAWRAQLPEPPVGPWEVSQAAAVEQPTREDSGGVPWLRFTTGQSLHSGPLPSGTITGPGETVLTPAELPAGYDARTLAVIVRGLTSTGATQYVAGWGSVGGAESLGEWQIIVTDTAGVLIPEVFVSPGAQSVSSGYALPGSGPFLVLATYAGGSTASAVTIRVVPATGTGASGSANRLLATETATFAVSRGATFSGRIAEVLVWRRALSAGDVPDLLAWASAEYGINGS